MVLPVEAQMGARRTLYLEGLDSMRIPNQVGQLGTWARHQGIFLCEREGCVRTGVRVCSYSCQYWYRALLVRMRVLAYKCAAAVLSCCMVLQAYFQVDVLRGGQSVRTALLLSYDMSCTCNSTDSPTTCLY